MMFDVEQIDRVIAVSGQDELVDFSHLFTETTKRDLVDNHLWLSVSIVASYIDWNSAMSFMSYTVM